MLGVILQHGACCGSQQTVSCLCDGQAGSDVGEHFGGESGDEGSDQGEEEETLASLIEQEDAAGESPK